MPYATGESPQKGDYVQRVTSGQKGTVQDVQLNLTSKGGRDQVSVAFDAGGVVAVSLADEYSLIRGAG
ncbi:MAG TPA: hypothetical protein VOA88_15765 [Candidatus Dormibacteraeota bacterium]|nr:hypothetical protein [Candidatus Dormibacteraeota bacterium]